jgi:hypothetical protein
MVRPGSLFLLALAPTVAAGCRRPPPKPIESWAPVASLAAGYDHACAVDHRGRVRCWGTDGEGALGVQGATHVDAFAPGRDVEVGGKVKTLAAGVGVTCALLESGAMRCWGNNASGELGTRHRRSVATPEGDVDVGGRVVEVALGATFACARLDSGAVRCWGAHMPTPFREGQVPADLPPIALEEPARSITADGWEACALLASNRVRCWGESTFHGEPYSVSGTFVEIDAGERVERISLQGSVFAITAEGALLRFQRHGGRLERRAPIALDAKIRAFDPGGQSSCGLLDGGRVRCWGDGERAGVALGLIGVPGISKQALESPSGADVDIGGRATAVASGNIASCALRDDGRVFCWGMVDLGYPVGEGTRIVGAKESPRAFGPVRVFDG